MPTELTYEVYRMLDELGLGAKSEFKGAALRDLLASGPDFPLAWIPNLRNTIVKNGVSNLDTVATYIDAAAKQQVSPGTSHEQRQKHENTDWTDEQWDRYWQRTTRNARVFADGHVARETAGDYGSTGPCPAEPHETECHWVKIADDLEARYT